jgi:putative addiction module killer protein
VESIERRVQYFHTEDGKTPYWEWRSSLNNKKTWAIIDSRIARLRAGNFGSCAPVGEGIMELKIHYGPGYRVYFGYWGHHTVLLLSGGDKSTQSKDILKAKVFWQDYKTRNL